jgi:hypothetical protein
VADPGLGAGDQGEEREQRREQAHRARGPLPGAGALRGEENGGAFLHPSPIGRRAANLSPGGRVEEGERRG